MTNTRIVAMSIGWVALSASVATAQDLSRYREFQLGMSLVAVAQQAGITPDARVLHQRPELIQELMWLPPRIPGSPSQEDSVRKVVFSGYNGQLFRVVATYAQDRTEGMTADDLVEAVSAKYGPATLPGTQITPPVSRAARDNDKILASWEDSQYSLTLFRSSYLSTFGLVVLSKRLDALARVAILEATLLDEQEAPQREIEREQNQTEENRVRHQTARRVNKGTFRP